MMKLAGLDLMKLHPTPTAQDLIIGPKSQLEQFLALLAALHLTHVSKSSSSLEPCKLVYVADFLSVSVTFSSTTFITYLQIGDSFITTI